MSNSSLWDICFALIPRPVRSCVSHGDQCSALGCTALCTAHELRVRLHACCFELLSCGWLVCLPIMAAILAECMILVYSFRVF